MIRLLGLAPTLGAALVLAACGGGGGTAEEQPAAPTEPAATAEAAGGGTTLQLSADAENKLAFNVAELTAPAGKVTLVMANPSALQHNVAIKGNGVDVKGEVVSTGGTSTVTAALAPGTYTVYCSVPGHEQGGMVATLAVTA